MIKDQSYENEVMYCRRPEEMFIDVQMFIKYQIKTAMQTLSNVLYDKIVENRCRHAK